LSRCLRWRRRRRSPFHHSEEVEAVSSLSFSDWSSLDEDSERNLEDDEDAATKTSEDSHLEWREEAERKAEEEEEEEDEMLEGKEVMLESFATMRKEERTRAAQDVRAESSPRVHGRVLACPQFHIARFTKVARIWKAVAERCKAFEDDASCSANGEGATAAAIIVISSDEEE
jgi:hypothetical protein